MNVISMKDFLERRNTMQRETFYAHELPEDILRELRDDYKGEPLLD